MTDPTFVYVTYIEATPERVWDALTDPELTAAYWGHSNVSTGWHAGDRWDHVRTDGSGETDGGGTVEESEPARRLVLSWGPPDGQPGRTSRVAFDIEPWDGIVRLTVTHSDLADEAERAGAAAGWAAVLSNSGVRLRGRRPSSDTIAGLESSRMTFENLWNATLFTVGGRAHHGGHRRPRASCCSASATWCRGRSAGCVSRALAARVSLEPGAANADRDADVLRAVHRLRPGLAEPGQLPADRLHDRRRRRRHRRRLRQPERDEQLHQRPDPAVRTADAGRRPGRRSRAPTASSSTSAPAARRIRGPDNTHMIVPNSHLVENSLVNFTLSDDVLRTSVAVGVAYGSPVRDGRARCCTGPSAEHDRDPDGAAPRVLFAEFGDNALTFDALFWIRARIDPRPPAGRERPALPHRRRCFARPASSSPSRSATSTSTRRGRSRSASSASRLRRSPAHEVVPQSPPGAGARPGTLVIPADAPPPRLFLTLLLGRPLEERELAGLGDAAGVVTRRRWCCGWTSAASATRR